MIVLEVSKEELEKKIKEKRDFILNSNKRIQQMQAEIRRLSQLILVSEGEARAFEGLMAKPEKKKVNNKQS